MQSQQRPLAHGQCYVFRTGLADHVCTCFDTPETRSWYNRSIPGQYNGTFDALLKITRNEGIRSLWSGLPPTLIMSLPNTVIYFTTYEQIKCVLGYQRTNTNPFIPGFAGGLARICAVLVTSPLELIRTKKMSEPLSYADLLATLRNSIENSGIRTLWRGLVPTLWRDLPFSSKRSNDPISFSFHSSLLLFLVVYWSAYERLRCQLLIRLIDRSMEILRSFQWF